MSEEGVMRKVGELRLYLDDYEQLIRELLDKSVRSPRIKYFLPLTLALSGRRIGEVLRLAVKDIDFEEHKVTWWIEKKRQAMYLTLPMPSRWFTIAQDYIVLNKITNELFPISRITAWRVVTDVTSELIGVRLSPHDLRHLFAMKALLDTKDYELVRR
ncbi:site-specific integrase [Vulcanisaeta distributa]|nr:site-specific integrase [Vulcanisaeta distributa]